MHGLRSSRHAGHFVASIPSPFEIRNPPSLPPVPSSSAQRRTSPRMMLSTIGSMKVEGGERGGGKHLMCGRWTTGDDMRFHWCFGSFRGRGLGWDSRLAWKLEQLEGGREVRDEASASPGSVPNGHRREEVSIPLPQALTPSVPVDRQDSSSPPTGGRYLYKRKASCVQ